jgi:hypothetical protein
VGYYSNPASDFVGVVAWGDGAVDAVPVSGGGGTYTFSDSHVYTHSGVYTVDVFLVDDTPGTAFAEGVISANITGGGHGGNGGHSAAVKPAAVVTSSATNGSSSSSSGQGSTSSSGPVVVLLTRTPPAQATVGLATPGSIFIY